MLRNPEATRMHAARVQGVIDAFDVVSSMDYTHRCPPVAFRTFDCVASVLKAGRKVEAVLSTPETHEKATALEVFYDRVENMKDTHSDIVRNMCGGANLVCDQPEVIVIEGLDGSGKITTLAKAIATDMDDAIYMRTPPASLASVRPIFDQIDNATTSRAFYAMSNYMLMHEIHDAWQSHNNISRKLCIIVDRWYGSTLAYSVAKSCSSVDDIHRLPGELFNWPHDLLEPELVIVLQLAEEIRNKRYVLLIRHALLFCVLHHRGADIASYIIIGKSLGAFEVGGAGALQLAVITQAFLLHVFKSYPSVSKATTPMEAMNWASEHEMGVEAGSNHGRDEDEMFESAFTVFVPVAMHTAAMPHAFIANAINELSSPLKAVLHMIGLASAGSKAEKREAFNGRMVTEGSLGERGDPLPTACADSHLELWDPLYPSYYDKHIPSSDTFIRYGEQIPFLVTMFSIGAVYVSITPLQLPCMTLFFFTQLGYFRFKVMFWHVKVYESR
eukprot:gene30697-38428_t